MNLCVFVPDVTIYGKVVLVILMHMSMEMLANFLIILSFTYYHTVGAKNGARLTQLSVVNIWVK